MTLGKAWSPRVAQGWWIRGVGRTDAQLGEKNLDPWVGKVCPCSAASGELRLFDDPVWNVHTFSDVSAMNNHLRTGEDKTNPTDSL